MRLVGMTWALLLLVTLAGCSSPWKVQGGPQECVAMCKGWGMELTGMVGVGKQGRAGGGASACVCELQRSSGGTNMVGSSGVSASTSAAVVAVQQAQQAAAAAAAHH